MQAVHDGEKFSQAVIEARARGRTKSLMYTMSKVGFTSAQYSAYPEPVFSVSFNFESMKFWYEGQ